MGQQIPARAVIDAYAEEVRRVYSDAEYRLLRLIAEQLERGIEVDDWEIDALARIQGVRRAIEETADRLRIPPDELEERLQAAWDGGIKQAVQDLKRADLLKPGFSGLSSEAAGLKTLAAKMSGALEQARFQIIRQVPDAYQRIIHEAVTLAQAGAMTRRQACQVALNRFVDSGIVTFRDRAGRNWDLASYAEMATRSTMAQAAVEGHLQALEANDHDLVMVTIGTESCPLCTPWEGRVLSISGNTQGYPTVAEARDAGLLHPNCTHGLDPYVPGLSAPLKRREVDEGGYEARQQQRYMEWMIRKWRLREAAAITDEEKRAATARRREWEARIASHVERYGRRRDREREIPGRAR